MSLNDDQNIECPLCMEPFEMDDFNFFPCACGYQICRFCWHRIRTDENGLCPACRKQYSEDPADFKPLSAEELQKIKTEKRQKDQQKKQKMSESRKHLANVRVVQKNLVFVVGLPSRLADPEVLKKNDYFGKFGKIHKVVVNQSTPHGPGVKNLRNTLTPSASAYVTYCKPDDALRAIKAVNNIQVDGRTIKASLGTTKYCSHFLKNQQCPKLDCMYLHELGDEAASFTKEDMQQGKHQEYEKKLQDQIVMNSNNNSNNNRKQTASPTPVQNVSNSGNDAWLCSVQTVKETRTSRSKDSSQSQKTDGKSNKSKANKQDGQKNKKSKNKSSDTSQHNGSSTKEETNSSNQRKSQKTKHKDAQSIHRADSPVTDSPLEDEDMNTQGGQHTTYVHISEETKPVSASIQIARSDSPGLPPSPISSSSSSLFTPFGSLSSNFLSSSSPSPPPSNSNPISFGSLGNSTNSIEDSGSGMENFAIPAPIVEQKQDLFNDGGDSLFSNMSYSQPGTEMFNGDIMNDEPSPSDNSPWNTEYYEDIQKTPPEDDLDFDPWNESSKGLADLIAKEAVHQPEIATPPGFFQPIAAPVSSQRVSAPPPGFGSRQVPPTTRMNGLFGFSNTDVFQSKLSQNGSAANNGQQYFHQDQSQNLLRLQNQYKPQFPQQACDILENVRLKKNLEEHVRNLLPDVVYQAQLRNIQKAQNQNGQTWNNPTRDLSWLSNDAGALNSGNMSSDGQRGNTHLWMKALQQLSLDEPTNTTQYNGHSQYTNSYTMRNQWPSSTQCPPPGFIAPSRSPVNSPFQHMQLNQKI